MGGERLSATSPDASSPSPRPGALVWERVGHLAREWFDSTAGERSASATSGRVSLSAFYRLDGSLAWSCALAIGAATFISDPDLDSPDAAIASALQHAGGAL